MNLYNPLSFCDVTYLEKYLVTSHIFNFCVTFLDYLGILCLIWSLCVVFGKFKFKSLSIYDKIVLNLQLYFDRLQLRKL